MSTTFGLFNTSVMGMSAQSDALATISENIANSGTTGYKEATTHFLTVLTGLQGSEMIGGGVTTVNRYEIASQGAIQSTSSATDLALKGSGFFVVSDSSGSVFLTRAGSFAPDSKGRLVNAAGYYLMGFDLASAPTSSSTNALTSMKTVQVQADRYYAAPSQTGKFAANLPSGATVVAAANLPSTNSATAAYSAKTSITAFDNLGNPITLDVYFSKTAANTWETAIYDHAAAAAGGGFPYTGGPLATQTLNFSAADGSLTSGSPLSFPVPGGATLTLDVSKMTQLGSTFGVNTINVDGNAAGSIQSVDISSDGTLSYKLSNGQLIPVYKIGIADVNSPNNLTNLNGNVYSANADSGQIMIGTAGNGGFGQIASGALENSTVDLATELSRMIVAQRSFTANTQVFQVASDVLQVLNNLK